jgi:glyoxylase-like metal-dependent hydrolase (beta-lactamase superfamily II)
VGDLAYNGMHAYLADGYWRDWLALLTRLERELPDDAVLHVGHGDPGTKSLLATQRRYVEAFVEAVRENAGAVTAGDQRAGGAGDASAPTTEALLFLMDLSIEPLLAELRVEGAPDGGNAASEN